MSENHKSVEVEIVNRIIGSLIEKERSSLRLSQIEVATRSGLSRTYLSDIERGLRNLSVMSLYKISTALGLKASEFLVRAELKLDTEVAKVPAR